MKIIILIEIQYNCKPSTKQIHKFVHTSPPFSTHFHSKNREIANASGHRLSTIFTSNYDLDLPFRKSFILLPYNLTSNQKTENIIRL